MRYLAMLMTGLTMAAAAMILPSANVSYAAFHCMRIHAVKAGFGGNANVQYIELRMDAGGQLFVAGHTVQFFDGSGTLKATFTFPANVVNSTAGDSILLATSDFNAAATGGAADFTFSNANTAGANGGDPLHPVQAPNGKVVWAPGSANCSFTVPVDSVAAGTATADYGTAAAALTGASDARALRLSNLNLNPTNNSAEYSLQAVATTTFSVAPANLATDFSTPRNNGRTVLKLGASSPASVGGISELPQVAGAPPFARGDGENGHQRWLWVSLATAGVLVASAAAATTARRLRARR